MNHQYDLSKIPAKVQGIFKRAYSGKSRQAAMKAKCYDCCCFVREEIEKCNVSSCPLHPYRPFGANTARKTAVKKSKDAEGVRPAGSITDK